MSNAVIRPLQPETPIFREAPQRQPTRMLVTCETMSESRGVAKVKPPAFAEVERLLSRLQECKP
jgi:hypothetical protein